MERKFIDIYHDRGGVLPYISHRGMCRPTGVGFLHRFGLKTGKHFVYFGLESGCGSWELRECMNIFIVAIPNE